ncbi:MAG: carboxymuconolactone decarboxylase family protein, partial [Myxococcales bacterium]|nr:carboxymuconolactone decarboxylase family protein [Myxococcales bacterium]
EHDEDPNYAAPLRDIKGMFGMLPNMLARMVNLPGLLSTYLAGYNAFRGSGLGPVEQEVVLLTISRFNRCTYCVAAHSIGADMAKAPAELVEALRAGATLPDARLDALAVFTTVMLERRGEPSRDELATFLAAGFAEPDVLAIVLAIAVKTISNYTNHLFSTPIDAVFAHRSWDAPGDDEPR